MAPSKVVLLACGSYNPPTNMHLRMFENARDYLQRVGNMKVVHGIISPVHDSYQKKDLIPAIHRCEMVRLAVKSNNWIHLSDWECNQPGWSRTVQVLQYHQNKLTSDLANCNKYPHIKQKHKDFDEVDDIPQNSCLECDDDVRQTESDSQVRLLLLCGADLLESFAVPNLWNEEDIETIVGQHGLVVITREGYNPYRFIYESDLLTKHMANIYVVTEWIANEVSSTKIRRAVRRGQSIKYLVPDTVETYIKIRGLYSSTGNETKPPPCNDGNIDTTDGSKVGQQTTRKISRQSTKQENAFNEANARRSSSAGRQSRDEIPKVSANSLGDLTNCEEEAKVRIQITKDGIRVISDKETTV